MSERYSRQERFYGIGTEGQQKLLHSRVAIIGLGALGSVSAERLARAGVGFLRLVDRDYIELSNLQRQTMFTEQDVADQTPKAAAAAEYLSLINSEIETDPVITDVNSGTIDGLIADVDLVIDATDNLETRYLINEACMEYGIPWIYGGALGASGMTMNIIPDDESPCFACFTQSEGDGLTCAVAGILNTTTAIIASLQCTEAIKLLTGNGRIRRGLKMIDLWNNDDETVEIPKRCDCPVCVRREYKYYGKVSGMKATSMCGRDSVQVVPEKEMKVDFASFASTYDKVAEAKVSYNKFTLDLILPEFEIKLFKNGRAIIKHVTDENKAKSIYTEYIGS